MIRIVTINEKALRVLLNGMIKLHKDIRLKYSNYRVIKWYVRTGVKDDSEGKCEVNK